MSYGGVIVVSTIVAPLAVAQNGCLAEILLTLM